MKTLVLLVALACVGAACGTTLASPGEQCETNYHATLARLDPQTGAITAGHAIGWPSQQDPMLHDGLIVTIETTNRRTYLSAWNRHLAQQWSVRLDDDPYAQDLQIRSDVAVVTLQSRVVAVALDRHKRMWTHDFSAVLDPPAITDDAVVTPVGRKLVALNRRTGKVMWSRRFESHPVTPARAGPNIVAGASRPSYGSKPGPSRALKGSTGKLAWSGPAPDPDSFRESFVTTSRAAVVDEEVGLGGKWTTLIGLRRDTGKKVWRKTFDRNDVYESLFTPKDVIVVPARPGHVTVLDVNSGRRLFVTRTPKRGTLFDVTGTTDRLLLASHNGKEVEVRASDHGKTLWKTRLGVPRAPAFGGSFEHSPLVTLSSELTDAHGMVWSLGRHGAPAWRKKLDQAVVMHPIALDDELFVISADPQIGCL